MAHHKRRRPKNRRAGCLMCKPWKVNGTGKGKLKPSEMRRLQVDRQGDEIPLLPLKYETLNWKCNPMAGDGTRFELGRA